MSSLIDMLQGALGEGGLGEISRKLGTDEGTAKNAVESAVPMLLGALSRNASSGKGAESLLGALVKDHDGSVLDNPSALLDNPQAGPGEGILRHVFGSRRPAVESGISKASGLDLGSTAQLLTMVAPLVMGALGKTQRQNQLDAGGLTQMLGQEGSELAKKQPQAMGMLGAILDADGDGDFDLGDAAKHGFKALGKFFKK
jgi:hypothetical protein